MSQSSINAAQKRIRVVVFASVCFLAGLAVGMFSVFRANDRTPDAPEAAVESDAVGISASTRAILMRLESPVDIRFYSLLDPATVSENVPAFAARVDRLLSEYERESNGRIRVTRVNSLSDPNAQAASADGIRPFNLDKGDACFLGLTVASGGQKETLPQLAPEWEQALEPDLSRTLVRVTAKAGARVPDTSAGLPAAAAADEVRRALPGFASVSLDEGIQVLREAALTEFKAATREMDVGLKEAEQRLLTAQAGKSEAEAEAAMKHLQQVQIKQTEKLKQIAARLQSQIAALEQMKGENRAGVVK